MIFRVITLALTVAALAWSLAQWRQTPAAHPEKTARGDRAKLLLLVFIGLAGEAARSRLEDNPLLFLWCTIALAPLAFVALYFIWRLYQAYRRSASGNAAQTITAATSPKTRKP